MVDHTFGKCLRILRELLDISRAVRRTALKLAHWWYRGGGLSMREVNCVIEASRVRVALAASRTPTYDYDRSPFIARKMTSPRREISDPITVSC